jgi:hypothetical protein
LKLCFTTAILACLMMAACAPGAPQGVDKARLDAAVADAVGDPNTCVLIGKAQSASLVYRFGTHAVCDRAMPSCEGQGQQTVGDLLKGAAAGKTEKASCPSIADGSRGVGWAAAPIPGKPLAYAVVMEGENTPPGLIIAEKVETAFAKVGLQPASN